MWLDLARYADSAGYATTKHGTSGVIVTGSFEPLTVTNLSTSFTIEQIAGDDPQRPTVL